MRLRNLVALGAAVVTGACGGGGVDLPVASALSIISGTDGQTAFAGARLPLALAVLATDAQGITVPRAEVRWAVTQGSGAVLSDAVTLSDGNGRAEVAVTLGQAAGSYTVVAELVANSRVSVSFSMTAAAAPQMSGLSPTSFTGGDTLTIQGSGLADTLLVEVGGTVARVLVATGTSLDVVVPECLVPGTITVALKYDAATLDQVSGSYQTQSAPLRLEPGEYASFDPAAVNDCAVFPAAGAGGALYLLAPQSVASVPGLLAPYVLTSSPAAPVVVAAERAEGERPAYLEFHDFLREMETEMARMPRAPLAPQFLAPAAVASGIEVGDYKLFRVCSEVRCTVEAVETVTGKARYVGRHAAIFEDKQAPAPLSDQEFLNLGTLIDEELYEVATRNFGAESDVDQNGLVLVLMTPVVNGLNETCHNGIITGFFYPPDIDPAFSRDIRSNRAEIFYSIVPDPGGAVACPLSKALVTRQMPVVFSHEMQHMISYNQHVLARAGDSEVLWLNEGLSHLSEELAAIHLESLGEQQLFSNFAIGNLYNAYLYLKEPGVHYLLPVEGTGTLAERGASWLFLRWVVDQFGNAVIRRMVETTLTGADNVTGAAGEPFSRMLSEWFLANYVSDLADFSTPPRLSYTTWSFYDVYADLHQQDPDRFPATYPLNPPLYSGGSFGVGGMLRSGSGDYYRVVQNPDQSGFTVRFTNNSGGPVSAAVTPRIEVVRIR